MFSRKSTWLRQQFERLVSTIIDSHETSKQGVQFPEKEMACNYNMGNLIRSPTPTPELYHHQKICRQLSPNLFGGRDRLDDT